MTLVDLVYHLFGGALGLRIHPHIQRPFRLKTKASRRIVELQAAHAEIGQDSVNASSAAWSFAKLCKRPMLQFDRRPIGFRVRPRRYD